MTVTLSYQWLSEPIDMVQVNDEIPASAAEPLNAPMRARRRRDDGAEPSSRRAPQPRSERYSSRARTVDRRSRVEDTSSIVEDASSVVECVVRIGQVT